MENGSNVDYMEEEAFKQKCEECASKYVDQRYVTPAWASKIRGEYASAVYRACNNNLNREAGIFNEDSSNADLASFVAKFFQKHPHIDYVCPTAWREKVVSILKENFRSLSMDPTKVSAPTITEDDVNPSEGQPETTASRPLNNPGQPVVQSMKEVSNKLWSAWRILSDLLSGQLLEKMEAGDVDEKAFSTVMKLRDSIKRGAADADDLATTLMVWKKVVKAQ